MTTQFCSVHVTIKTLKSFPLKCIVFAHFRFWAIAEPTHISMTHILYSMCLAKVHLGKETPCTCIEAHMMTNGTEGKT